jgi:FtsP/CotA-like multicopper oxidase with cupredoxin domain
VQTTTDIITLSLDHYRRRFLRNAALLGAAAMARPLSADRFPAPDLAADICASPGPPLRKLMIPGESGYLGQLAPRGMPVALTARQRKDLRSRTARLSTRQVIEAASTRIRRWSSSAVSASGSVSPISCRSHDRALAWPERERRQRWQRLGPRRPGEVYDYDFEIRNRSAMYWYHPHPHGRSAGQTYQGLFGTVLVEDDAERSLRAALDLIPVKRRSH